MHQRNRSSSASPEWNFLTAYNGKRVLAWYEGDSIGAIVSKDPKYKSKNDWLPLFNAETERRWHHLSEEKQEEYESTAVNWNLDGPPEEVKREYVTFLSLKFQP